MDLVLIQLEHLITKTSDVIWPVFVPFMLILGAYMAFTTIFKIQPKLTKPSKLKFKNMIGPASISLGAMVGTGAIVGVLGALSKLYGGGQHHVEAIVALPVGYLCGFTWGGGVVGVWVAFPAGLFTAGFLFWLRFRYRLQQLMKK